MSRARTASRPTTFHRVVKGSRKAASHVEEIDTRKRTAVENVSAPPLELRVLVRDGGADLTITLAPDRAVLLSERSAPSSIAAAVVRIREDELLDVARVLVSILPRRQEAKKA